MSRINKVCDGVAFQPQHPLGDGFPGVLRRKEDNHVPNGKSAPASRNSFHGDNVSSEIDGGKHARTTHLKFQIISTKMKKKPLEEDEGRGAHEGDADDVVVDDMYEACGLENESSSMDRFGSDLPPRNLSEALGGAAEQGAEAAPH